MRGNHRQIVFFTIADFRAFESLLIEAAERYAWDILAACLLNNHYHLVVRTRDPSVAEGMQWLNSLYVRGFNKRHGLVGHLFQRRYFSELIEDDEHLRDAIRYVMLNPVRAGLCLRPERWQWSTCGASLGLEKGRLPLDLRTLQDLFGSVQALENYLRDGNTSLPMPVPWG
jgi:REP element-mobilizing transposase RayT